MNLDTRLDPDEREQLAHLAELLVTGLSFVFVGLLVVEYGLTLSPTQSRWVELAGWCIWVVFALDFVVQFALSDAKGRFLRQNWLTAWRCCCRPSESSALHGRSGRRARCALPACHGYEPG